jgi:hypothetical protein
VAFDFQYSVRRAVAGLGAAVLAAVLATLALTALLYAMQWLPRAGILAHIRSSFTNGALQEQDWLVHNDRLGLNQYSDCMLIQMFFFRREAWADTVAPIVVFNDWPVPLWADDGEQLSECAIARTAAFSEAPFALYPAQSYFPYGRYMHAYRLPAYLLLEQFDVGAIRRLYRMMAFGMLVVILVTQLLVMLWRAERAEDRSRAGPHVLQGSFFVILSLIFIHFYALELYALSLVQAPSDILIFGAIAVIALRPITSTAHRMLCGLCGLFGALIFAFESLYGALPLGLAALIGCSAMKADRHSSAGQIATAVCLAGVSFVVGAGVALLVKLVTLAVTFGPQELTGFFSQLNYRMTGGGFSLSDLWRSLGESMDVIFFEDYRASRAFLFGTGLYLIVAYGIALAHATRAAAVQAHGLLLSVLVIGIWYLVFRNHSVIHAGAMVRLLVWPLIATAGMVTVALAGVAQGASRGVAFEERVHLE